MESAETRKQGLLLWFSLIWSIVLLGFTAYVFESFLGGWLASQRQVLGKCLDGRPAGDAWSTAEFSIRPRALSFKEKWEPSTETPEINCHFPVFVYRCPSWASLDSFEECKEDSTDLPMLHRARQEKTGVFCWGKLGFYMWDTHRCASDVWNCTTGACSGYLKSERLCAAELRSEAYACWFDPVNPAVGVQTRRYEYCTWTGLLALVLAVLTTVASASSTYFGSKLVRGLSERGFLERSRVREFICGPIPKYALLIICLIALIVFTEAVLFCLLLPGQTYYSIWGAAELPSSESLRVSDLHGLHSEAESPVSYGFNQPSFLARAARISVLVFQIYLMIALLVVSILVIIKYSARSRTRPSNGDYLRLPQ
ncbi:unnamed protein product [Effrenium voratum]|uniref:Transmembrane protein n=1 Tax=Effrenium voratum TaxID=2562239 RepID=A0AA36HSQ2_9DINO|nr:unnamed protein product [Effrenium voratum]